MHIICCLMRLINFSSRTCVFGKWVGQDLVGKYLAKYLLLAVDVWHYLPTIIPGWVVMNVTTYHLKQWRSTAQSSELYGLRCLSLLSTTVDCKIRREIIALNQKFLARLQLHYLKNCTYQNRTTPRYEKS